MYKIPTYSQLTAAIFNSSLIHVSCDLRSNMVVLSDPENMGIAVGTFFLSCIEAEIHV